MAYDIVFVDKEDAPVPGSRERAVGENIFLSSLPVNPKVFAFLFPGSLETSDVEKRLRSLGEKTGDNLFVNIGTLADPDYDQAQKRFRIDALPAIVVTAISPLAATPDGESAFVRLDGKSLFARPEELVRTVEELFNLFLSGEISRAVVTGWTRQGSAALLAAAQRLWGAVQPVIAWVAERDLKFEFATAKIEIKESGRH